MPWIASEEYVRRAAVCLRRSGVEAAVVMEALQVKKWTLAGWLADDSKKLKKASKK